jgi:hypothetical protein
MKDKLNLFVRELKEKGLFYGLKRLTGVLIRPITNFTKQKRFLIELFHGFFARIKFVIPIYSNKFGLVKFPQTGLVKEVRQFWYSNLPDSFDLGGEKIRRREIFLYGGPNPKFSCSICQKAEWLSRIRQKNLFTPHSCPQAKECEDLCQRQGNDLWSHYHQNFDFSIGCDSNLPAPKLIYCLGTKTKKYFFEPGCDNFLLLLRRRLAFTCQVEVTDNPFKVNWSNYDLAWVGNLRDIPKFPRPNIPVILYGHDFWFPDDKIYQWVIDWLKPDIFLSVCPGPWQENFRLPAQTKIVFYPFFDSLFFARPNLTKKELDLLVIGAKTSSFLYQPRIDLDKQIAKLPSKYKIAFPHLPGADSVFREGSLCRRDPRTGKLIYFLNKWSEYLGKAKYVIFGRMKYPVLAAKYYEALGSGAIPIFPEVPDLKYLGVKPFEHYIPLSEVEGNNQKLAYYLDNYDKFR